MADSRFLFSALWLALKAAVQEFNPAWIILDPLVAFHGLNENTATEMRRLINMFTELAQASNTAITVVQHPRKSGAPGDIYSVRGSGDLVASARAVLRGTPARDEGVSALVVDKLSIGPIPPPQGFKLVKGGVRWLGEVDLPRTGSMRDKADDFLQEVLADGPLPYRMVKQLARNEQLGMPTVDAARRDLEIIVMPTRHGKTWALPR